VDARAPADPDVASAHARHALSRGFPHGLEALPVASALIEKQKPDVAQPAEKAVR
jgi:hypothetical protein